MLTNSQIKNFFIAVFMMSVVTSSYASPDNFVTPLKGFSPSIQDNSDLANFDQAIEGANVVGLGESTHGTSEFFQMKHRLLKHLVEEKGFTLFAMEVGQANAAFINDYVLHGNGDPKQLLKNVYCVPFETQEVLDMIIWMHDYNLSHNDKIQFMGIDMQDDSAAIQILTNNVTLTKNKMLIAENQKASQALATLNKGITQLSQDISANKSDAELLKERQLLLETATQTEFILKKFKTDFTLDKETLSKTLGDTNYNWTLQTISLLEQYTELMPAEVSSMIPSLSDDISDINLRDRLMSENILWIRKQNPRAKLVVWAHSGHIQRTYEFGEDPSDVTAKLWKTMGMHLAETLGDDYRAMTFLTYRGTYTALDENMHESIHDLYLPPDETIESSIDKMGLPQAFINLRNKAILPDFLQGMNQTRQIGAQAEGAEQFVPVRDMSKTFDGIVYLRDTTAAVNFYLHTHETATHSLLKL